MLQKYVDRDVEYVVMVVHICCKLLFPMFHLFFRRMLQVFYLDVAYVCNGFKCFSCIFASVSYACFKCFICLQIYIASVASGCFKSRSDVASPSLLFCCLASVSLPRRRLGIHRSSPSFSMLVTLGPTRNPRGRAKWRGKRLTGAGVRTARPSGRPSTSHFDFPRYIVLLSIYI